MNVLVIGSGGREHAIAWKLLQDTTVKTVYCIPGNGGISRDAKCISIPVDDFDKITGFVKENKIDITVVGPELPLVNGIVDYFRKQGLKIFGPGQQSARLEGSKIFAKNFMKKYNIPTADFVTFDNFYDALKFVEQSAGKGFSVIKADGLCAGKGVFVCNTLDESISAVGQCIKEKVFGDAGEKIIVEQKLAGEEVSLLCFCDGENIIPMPLAQDHKRVYDNDKGPNTGGMGAYSPVKFIKPDILNMIKQDIINNFVKGLKSEGMDYTGVIYFGILISGGKPYVLEFNVRFGDPETQAILPILNYDLAGLFLSTVDRKLSAVGSLAGDTKSAVCVVLSSGGYPGNFEKGLEISGLENVKDALVFHSGTQFVNDKFYTNGGRVLGVTGVGKDFQEAREKVYTEIKHIKFDKMHYRTDIGKRNLIGN